LNSLSNLNLPYGGRNLPNGSACATAEEKIISQCKQVEIAVVIIDGNLHRGAIAIETDVFQLMWCVTTAPQTEQIIHR
jgi:hypothetical protein